MAYDPTALAPIDTTSKMWALAWTRFFLRDTDGTTEVYSDTELAGVLDATAQALPVGATSPTTYYRPHQAAADLIEGDPDRKVMERLMSWQGQYRNAEAVARAILAAGAWVDDAIHDAAGVYPERGGTLEAVF